mgnify:CR=1 FL=1|tara:strand:+ start:15775 stop:16746 length:972 start_codon:yes stop_codon:yes gene_type:complete
MFGFGKKQLSKEEQDSLNTGLADKLRKGLSKTRTAISSGINGLFLRVKSIDEEVIEELEMLLLTADVGIDTTEKIISELRKITNKNPNLDSDAVLLLLKDQLKSILKKNLTPVIQADSGNPQVILVVGVNGAGKTTTIGKLAKNLTRNGEKVMLAAGDTFRAAAVEQLEIWGNRNDIPVVAKKEKSDPASVIYESLQIAKSKDIDVLIADTAGRLQNKTNLMDELKKIKRVIKKFDEKAPHEVMLVIDASMGQNALNQAMQFHETIGLTGITITKLDGTAKGGIIFAIADKISVPIRFIGVGENIEDLRLFNADVFIDALFEK